VGHPSEYFKIGDEVDVVVLRFDRDKERVSLGYKQRFEDPWILVPEKYPVGKRVSGKVVSIVDYGAFVVLEEGVEGRIHVSEMSWTKKVKNPRSILEVGRDVDVVVSDVDIEKRRLSLSLRATEPNPWEQVADTYHVGSRVHGVVRNLTDFGAFVEIVPGVDGLVHISDMSWTRRINHPSEVVQKGQEVDAVITAIDIVNQRISLSMKELLPNEWEEYANSHSVGDVVGGSVTNVTDFGVFVELSPGVEGLCHISEIDRDSGLSLAEMFIQGQRVRCRILRIDWNENRIGLSMHGVSQEGAEEEVETPADGGVDAPQVETAMAAALRAGGILVAEAEDDSPTESLESQEGEDGGASPDDEAAPAAEDESGEQLEVDAAEDSGETEPEETEPEATEPEAAEPAEAETAEADATEDVPAHGAAEVTQDSTEEEATPPVDSDLAVDELLAREGITGEAGVAAQESESAEEESQSAEQEAAESDTAEPPVEEGEAEDAEPVPTAENGADTATDDGEKSVETQES